ncbi:hydroxyethylthiazole kinase [Ornithinibacillus sp. L9]|uniref:Hydroxyethylthiazole kinase n=1 Tax=Ornithinibacillus caprae TaxID=2678566 RepID=A0A6N8FII8_9BACI|nr:hydroxyethylthiazole kinase [Ornithinibacillus caprae]MUK89410.1 hydroxyethylthiazole kinase [Ornithinibacillus caprae]
MNYSIIKDVGKKQPLIHHLTNQVVMNFTANGLLAFGGAPIMAKAEEEAKDMATVADGVLINIGTLNLSEVSAMILAGKTANDRNIPVVLDPVGVVATPFRSSMMKKILNEVQPTAIKGNASELAHLVDIPWKSKGVESIGDGDAEEVAIKIAKTYKTTAVLTGKTDIICTSSKLIHNQLGNELLTKITGAGCLLGSILTACLTTKHSIDQQALAAVSFYGLAADYAASKPEVKGPGTFIPHFIDALSMNIEEFERR